MSQLPRLSALFSLKWCAHVLISISCLRMSQLLKSFLGVLTECLSSCVHLFGFPWDVSAPDLISDCFHRMSELMWSFVHMLMGCLSPWHNLWWFSANVWAHVVIYCDSLLMYQLMMQFLVDFLGSLSSCAHLCTWPWDFSTLVFICNGFLWTHQRLCSPPKGGRRRIRGMRRLGESRLSSFCVWVFCFLKHLNVRRLLIILLIVIHLLICTCDLLFFFVFLLFLLFPDFLFLSLFLLLSLFWNSIYFFWLSVFFFLFPLLFLVFFFCVLFLLASLLLISMLFLSCVRLILLLAARKLLKQFKRFTNHSTQHFKSHRPQNQQREGDEWLLGSVPYGWRNILSNT